jgi:hypothetical protein
MSDTDDGEQKTEDGLTAPPIALAIPTQNASAPCETLFIGLPSERAAAATIRPLISDLRLVEPDGIEPTTSCLQSTRSPN